MFSKCTHADASSEELLVHFPAYPKMLYHKAWYRCYFFQMEQHYGEKSVQIRLQSSGNICAWVILYKNLVYDLINMGPFGVSIIWANIPEITIQSQMERSVSVRTCQIQICHSILTNWFVTLLPMWRIGEMDGKW